MRTSKSRNPNHRTAALGRIIWLTGLSGAGKTTLATPLGEHLSALGHPVVVLDADIVRERFGNDLGFTREDRCRNILRLCQLAEPHYQTGATVIVAAISPFRDSRQQARQRLPRFCEVHVNAPLSVCEERDVKGLYKKARAGQIPNFTGIDSPYEQPVAPEVECHTDQETVNESLQKILGFVQNWSVPDASADRLD